MTLTMNLTLTLPDEPALTRLGPERLRLELACALYARGEVGAVAGAEIAGVDLFTFQAALRERDIPGHYGLEALEQDVTVIRHLSPGSPLPPGLTPREKSATTP